MQIKNAKDKIDYAILSEYTQKEYQPDGSLLCLKYVEEGEDAVTLRKGCYGSYTLDVSRKIRRLVKFFSIKRNSANRYYLTACEVGAYMYCGQFNSMSDCNEWLRDNFPVRLDTIAKQARGKRAAGR